MRIVTNENQILFLAIQKGGARSTNPCIQEVERVTNAMEAAEYNVRPIHKYVKDMEDCYRRADEEHHKSKASTLYYLSQYLDQKKNKTK
jgi:hypothetical protein